MYHTATYITRPKNSPIQIFRLICIFSMSALVILNISIMGSNFRALWVQILEQYFKKSIKCIRTNFIRYKLNCIKKNQRLISASQCNFHFQNKILRLFRLFICTNKKEIKRWHNILWREGAIYYSFYNIEDTYVFELTNRIIKLQSFHTLNQ